MPKVKMLVHALLVLLVFASAMVGASREGLAQAADSGLDIRVNFRVPFSGYKHDGYPELLGYDDNRPADFCVSGCVYGEEPVLYYSELPAVRVLLGGVGLELAIGYRWKYFGLYIDWNADVLRAAYMKGSGKDKSLEVLIGYFTLRGFIPINDAVYIDLAFGLGGGIPIGGFLPYGFEEDYCCPTMGMPLVFKGSVGFTYFLDDWFGIGAEVTCSGFFSTPYFIIAPAFRTVFQF